MSLNIIFATVAGVMLAIPFIVWLVIRFRAKILLKFSPVNRKIVALSFIIGMLLGLLFFLLAIFV